MKLHRNRVFKRIGFPLFECNQLDADPLEIVQVLFAEFFKKQLRVRLDKPVVTADPTVVLTAHVVEKQEIVAVVDEVGFVTAVAYDFTRLHGQVGEENVQPFALGRFRDRFGFRFRRLRRRDGCLRSGNLRNRRTLRTLCLFLFTAHNHAFAD